MIPKWLSDIFAPDTMQDLDIHAILLALQEPGVRAHWLRTSLDEIRDVNLKIHRSVLQGTLYQDFERESSRLQGIIWALEQIVRSKSSMDLDRSQNHTDQLEGVAVSPV